jgi:two-component system OmpR family response regulator
MPVDRAGGMMAPEAPQPQVLVVDDEEPIADLIAMTLRDDGFRVRTTNDGRSALAVLESSPPDLVVLDVMLPDIDGFSLHARAVDRGHRVPVMFLTARDSVDDKVRGLTLGAYDYMTKPFSPMELVARARSILRRSSDDAASARSRLTYADLELDQETHEAWRAGRPLRLTPTEFRLLRYLMLNPRRVLSKYQILDQVWDDDFEGDAHVVENYISYLRKRVDAEGDPLIHTVRGVGYCLRAPAADGSSA